MSSWLFVLGGLSLLAFLERKEDFSPTRLGGNVLALIKQSFDIFLSAILIVLFYILVFEKIKTDPLKEYEIPVIFLSAFLTSRILKKSNAFFLVVTGLCFFALNAGNESSFWMSLCILSGLSLGIFLFQTGLISLKQRLIFSPVPEALKGVPILFFLAAILSVIFAGFHGLVCYNF